jgi:hypothetical protein
LGVKRQIEKKGRETYNLRIGSDLVDLSLRGAGNERGLVGADLRQVEMIGD